VVGGDTCEAIATAHNVNTTLLHENNPQIDHDCSNIYIGEVLCVAPKVIVPPPAGDKPFPIPSTATPAVPHKTPDPQVKTPEPTKTPKPEYTPKPEDDGNDDDEDLPWCDEL
jgi:hypothetical protein